MITIKFINERFLRDRFKYCTLLRDDFIKLRHCGFDKKKWKRIFFYFLFRTFAKKMVIGYEYWLLVIDLKDKWKPENVSYNEFGGNDSK